MSIRKDLERAKQLRRLYERQLNKIPTKLPEAERKALAATAMDELVSPRWRTEITLVDLPIASDDIVGAPPTSSPLVKDVGGRTTDDVWVRRVGAVVAEEGEHPDSVPDVEQDSGKENLRRALFDLHAKVCQLMKLM